MARAVLSFLLLVTLAVVPAGCVSVPPGGPVTIPTLAAPPPMTGNLVADSAGGGWSGTLRLDLSSTCYALLGRATDPATGYSYVYLGIACDDFAPTAEARVVLGIVTKNTLPTCQWKIHFNPIPVGGGGMITADDFWRNSLTWNNLGTNITQPPGAGWPLGNTMSWAQGGASNLWTMEAKIYVNANTNNNGVWFPAAGTLFSLFLDVLNGSDAGGAGNIQRPWPSGCGMFGEIKTHTPIVASWGQAQF